MSNNIDITYLHKVIEIPVSPKCAEILAQKEHVLLGVSACVGYYTVERIIKLIKWASDNFKSYEVLLSGKKPLCANFEALGKNRPSYKASQYANNIFNKVKKAFSFLNLDINKKIIVIENYFDNDQYIKVYSKILTKYNNDIDFKQKCRKETKAVLSNNIDYITEDMIDKAVNYLLWELPFYIDSPSILSANSSLLVYHKDIEFFTNLYKNRNDNLIAETQGHLIINFD